MKRARFYGAARLRLLEAVEELGGVRAGKHVRPVRLPLLDGVGELRKYQSQKPA